MSEPTAIVPESGVRSCLNATGSDIAAGLVVALDSTKRQITLPAAETDVCYGVTMAAIPDGSYGDIQVEGVAICQAAGALATPGVELKPATDGQVDAHDATNTKIGLLLTTAGGAADLVEVELYKRKTP